MSQDWGPPKSLLDEERQMNYEASLRKQLAALTEATRWHPWPEEKPPGDDDYLVEAAYRDVYPDTYEDGHWCQTVDDDVVKWAYLPAPYVPPDAPESSANAPNDGAT